VAASVRDAVVAWVRYWSERATFRVKQLLTWLGIPSSKYYNWCGRHGQPNQHNAQLPRATWLRPWERQAILDYQQDHPEEGYRRLTYMMLDADVVAVSPSSVYRVLKAADRLRHRSGRASSKGTGFVQATQPHEHWHMDVSYLNICGTFYYLCSILDGYSRYLVHWEIRERMTETDVETILQRGREAFPEGTPRIISDNGPQFVARDFKAFVRMSGMTHVRTSPFYPQSNGKIESWHKTVKRECIRPKVPLSLEDARRIVAGFVNEYNTNRLHGGIGYITPQDRLEGREQIIQAERQRKRAEARLARQIAHRSAGSGESAPCLDPSGVEAAPATSVPVLC
jgi:putative transposase